MSVKPIIFSGPMVRALLEGRKTQTRRVLKLSSDLEEKKFTGELVNYYGDHRLGMAFEGTTLVQPVGFAPRDRLWVRETHAVVGSMDPGWVLYRASGYESECQRHGFDKPYPPESGLKWRPSIFMPRRLSRLTLEVTDVRVQRLQEIDEDDAIAEGVNGGCIKCGEEQPCACVYPEPDHRDAFCRLWNNINEKRGFGWNANPWVVALTFIVSKQNVDDFIKQREVS